MTSDWKSRWGGVAAGLFAALNVAIGRQVLSGAPARLDRIVMMLQARAGGSLR